MDMDRYTRKSLEVVEKAKEKALEFDNQELTQLHLLAGLLETDESLIPKIFEKMDVNVSAAVDRVENKLASLPKVSGGNMYAGNEFSKALIQAEKEAKQMGDEYISVEHLFLGIISKADRDVKELLKVWNIDRNSFLTALASIRGNKRWTVILRRTAMRQWRSSAMIWWQGLRSRSLILLSAGTAR